MSGRADLPSKLASSTQVVKFDFTSDLASGETISTQVTTAAVFSGTDAAPSAIISGAATASSAVVSQTVTAGTVGVIYELTCTITTSAGQTLLKVGLLAVIPKEPGA